MSTPQAKDQAMRREKNLATGHATGQTQPRSPSEMLEPARGPARPRVRRAKPQSPVVSGVVRWSSNLLTLMLGLILLLSLLVLAQTYQLERPGPLDVTKTFAVPKGEGRIEIAERLEREGIIDSRWTFVLGHLVQSRFSGRKNTDLKAGEYEFKKGASMRAVLDALEEGRSVLNKITIPEGLTSQQIVDRLKADANLAGEIAEIPAEGTLLPDTYRFSRGMARQEIIEIMQAKHQEFLAGLWEKRAPDLPLQSLEQALVLASIVEKETGRADERERVAAVFVNRLKKRMRLQSDPTIIYGIVGGQGTLGRPITRADIDGKTPFNTYQIDGLPPSPICNPGRSAIEAVLNPAKTNDLYFVADGSGGHTFSESLKDHNAAVANWRKVEKDMRAKEAQQPAGTRAVVRNAPAPGSKAPPPSPVMPVAAPEAGISPEPAAQGAAEAAAPVQAAPILAPVKAGAIPLPVRKPKK